MSRFFKKVYKFIKKASETLFIFNSAPVIFNITFRARLFNYNFNVLDENLFYNVEESNPDDSGYFGSKFYVYLYSALLQ